MEEYPKLKLIRIFCLTIFRETTLVMDSNRFHNRLRSPETSEYIHQIVTKVLISCFFFIELVEKNKPHFSQLPKITRAKVQLVN